MVYKKIYRYTNVELLDTIKNSRNFEFVEKAKAELHSRKLNKEELDKIEFDYKQYKAFQESRKETPLATEEWLTFFFLPFFTPKPRGREDYFSESELERFKRHGFKKKYTQAQKTRIYGYAFWFTLIILLAFITSII